MPIVEKWRELHTQLTDFLTGSRPPTYVRRMQLIFLVATLLLFTFVLTYHDLRQPTLDLSSDSWDVGQSAPADVVAEFQISFPRDDLLDLLQGEASRQTPAHFVRDFSVLQPEPVATAARERERDGEEGSAAAAVQLHQLLESDLALMASCRREHLAAAARNRCMLQGSIRWRHLLAADMEVLFDITENRLRDSMLRIANLVAQNYILVSNLPPPGMGDSGTIRVTDLHPGHEPLVQSLSRDRLVAVSSLRQREMLERQLALIEERIGNQPHRERLPMLRLLSTWFEQIELAHYSAEMTAHAMADAVRAVEVPLMQIQRGDTILRSGEPISIEKRRALEQHNRERIYDKLRRLLAVVVQQSVLLGMILYFAFRFTLVRLKDVSSNVIIFVTVWCFALLLFAQSSIWLQDISYNSSHYFFGAWVPIAAFVVFLAVIFGEVLTIPVALYLAFMVFMASDYSGSSFFIAITGAMVGTILGARIKRRVNFIYVALALVLVGQVMVTAGFLYSGRQILMSFDDGFFHPAWLASIRSNFYANISALLVIAILPFFESLFNLPTRFKLQELSDPSNPLLQELFRRAPSTWTHTLMVASMTERACDKLGLNTMLARTGVYYHDIGKMVNAGFFVENQHLIPRPENIAKNDPVALARTIIDHVTDGVAMARAERLPREVIDFIPEHHGTSTMAFFYHKALEKMKRRVRRDDFRYPGPKPRTKESAIVMIADSVEAASRSLDDYSEQSIEHLIQKIITMKLNEEQLDDSGLTIGDLAVIRRSFREILMSSYHFRPRYPESDDTKRLEAEKQAVADNVAAARKKARSVAAKKRG